MSAVTKAFFMGLDGGGQFEVQYNPKEFKFDKPVSWKEHDDQGQDGALEFQKVSPATIQVDLTFDTTKDNSDVREEWVNKLLELTNPECTPSDGEAKELGKQRPTRVLFNWGSFIFVGVIESVNVTYIMFAPSGNPIRAKVTVKLKEWTPDNTYSFGGGSSGYDTEPVKLAQVSAGQTLSTLALQNGTTAQAIADANNISDPMNVEAGTEVVIPSGR